MLRVGAAEDRNCVLQAANWALRQTGKRNQKLDRAAIREAVARSLRERPAR